MVPDGWELKSFGEITNIANGQVDPRVEPYCSLPHVGPENVISDSAKVVGVKSCGELDLISGKYQFDQHAIVYSKIRPNLNKVCIPGFSGLCSADMYPLWPKSGVDTHFLLQLMLGPEFVGRTTAVSMRTGMPKINRSDLAAIPVKLPPIAEQMKVAKILSTWDQAITTTEQLLGNSQQQKKALMQRLLTGRKRLTGFNSPWRKLPLTHCLLGSSLRNSGITQGADEIMSVNKSEGMIPMRQETIGKSIERYKVVKSGWFAYNPMRINVGSICRWEGERDCLVSPDYVVFSCDEKSLLGSYFGHFRQAEPWTDFMRNAGNGSVRVRIYLNDLSLLKIPLPPLDEQEKIAAVLTTADQGIQNLQAKLSCLKREKKALMQQLLTGKRRVTSEPKEAV